MEFFYNALAGLVSGTVTGFGIGGGTILILYLTTFGKMEQLAAQGINLLYFLPTAGSALVVHIKNRLVKWKAVLFASLAGVPMTILTSLLAADMETALLRRIFGAFLIAVGISELFRKKKQA